MCTEEVSLCAEGRIFVPQRAKGISKMEIAPGI